jgi:hypothetical protein
MSNEISLEGIPQEIKDKIFALLGRDTLQVKKVTLQEVLPTLDLPRDKKEEIQKLLEPKSLERARQDEINHTRLEKIMKNRSNNPDVSRSIETIRQELRNKKNSRG